MDKVWEIAKNNSKKIMNIEQSSVSVLIKLTSNCRSKCNYCLSWKTNKEYLSFDTLKRIFSDIGHFSASRITFSGGEPTTHPDFEKIIYEAKTNCENIAVISDGQFSNAQGWFPYVDEMIFSIDTTDRVDYKLTRGIDGLNNALNNLKIALNLGIKTSVNIVLTKFAIEKLLQSVEFFIKLGVDNIYLMELETHLNISKDLVPAKHDVIALKKEIIPMLKNRYRKVVHFDEDALVIPFQERGGNELSCLIPWMHVTIRPNGEVYPCCRIGDDTPDGNDLSYCLGNIKNSKLSDFWTSSLRKGIINSIMLNPPFPCYNCTIGASFDHPKIWDQIESIRM